LFGDIHCKYKFLGHAWKSLKDIDGLGMFRIMISAQKPHVFQVLSYSLQGRTSFFIFESQIHIWLVVSTILKNMGVRQWEG